MKINMTSTSNIKWYIYLNTFLAMDTIYAASGTGKVTLQLQSYIVSVSNWQYLDIYLSLLDAGLVKSSKLHFANASGWQQLLVRPS